MNETEIRQRLRVLEQNLMVMQIQAENSAKKLKSYKDELREIHNATGDKRLIPCHFIERMRVLLKLTVSTEGTPDKIKPDLIQLIDYLEKK